MQDNYSSEIDTIETKSQDVEDKDIPIPATTADFQAATIKMILDQYGPKAAWKKGLFTSDNGGWRRSFTKPEMIKVLAERRVKEKNRRRVKQAQRKAGQRCTN